MVVAPDADGLNIAVYTVELDEIKLLIVPPDTVISPTIKLVVALEVNVTTSESSLVVAPSLTILEPLVAVMDIVGTTLS